MKDKNKIQIGLIGHKFIGTAHSHAVTDVSIFFDLKVQVIKRMICANEKDIFETAKRWGWERPHLIGMM